MNIQAWAGCLPPDPYSASPKSPGKLDHSQLYHIWDPSSFSFWGSFEMVHIPLCQHTPNLVYQKQTVNNNYHNSYQVVYSFSMQL